MLFRSRMTEAFQVFDPEKQARLKQLPFGKLELYVRYPVINGEARLSALPPDKAPAAAYLVPPYQQVHTAMLHWLEILCLKLQPVFAVGYYITHSFIPSEGDFLEGFDIATITALEQQQFPPLRDWLESVYALYVPEPLMASPQAEEWLSSPGMWKRQLPNDAWLAYSMPETLDEARIRDFCTACDTILEQRDRAQLPLARNYLQRAQEIAATIQREHYPFNRLLSQLTYLEEHPEMFK